jgi:regulator of sirC expression with transglutaminase-like and TPR domain
MTRTLASDLFREMVSRPPEQVNLAIAALLIALDEYPGLNVSDYLERIDELAERTSARLHFDAAERPMETIESINYQLFEIEGFRGNREDYYDPRNSFLNDVLDRKVGIPITLSVLYMEVGRRIGLRIEGVGMPGHFVVKCKHNGVEIFIDPFGRGEVLLPDACERKLTQLHGKDFQFDRSCLEAVTHTQTLTRILRNLKAIYWNQRNYAKALGVIEKLLLINPTAAAEIRDRGFTHYQLNHLSRAIKDWSRYLELRPSAPDAAEVAKSLKVAAQVRAFRN